jgi:type II secretory pathway pseudopilin PulG
MVANIPKCPAGRKRFKPHRKFPINRPMDFRHILFMMNLLKPHESKHPRRGGFTLVELLVVIGIIIVLAALVTVGMRRFIENGRKVQALAQFRDFKVGMALFETDYNKPPIPQSKRDTGWDTIYGDPGGNYSTQFLIAALAGEDKDYPYVGENFSTRDVNPRNESYMVFPPAPDKKGGVGPDGKLYDPWGHEVMVAINGFKSTNPSHTLVDFNNGQNDRRLHTWGLAEYTETKPKEQSYVFWSYGKDGKKGDGNPDNQAVVPLAGSDDVISW